jgi:hypothetical protein
MRTITRRLRKLEQSPAVREMEEDKRLVMLLRDRGERWSRTERAQAGLSNGLIHDQSSAATELNCHETVRVFNRNAPYDGYR